MSDDETTRPNDDDDDDDAGFPERRVSSGQMLGR